MNLSPYCGSLSGIRKHWIILSLGLEPWPHCRYIDVKTVMPLPQIALNTLLIVFDLEGWNCTLHTQAMLGLQSRSPRDHTLLDRMNGCLENHLATQPKDNFSKSYHFLWVEFFFQLLRRRSPTCTESQKLRQMVGDVQTLFCFVSFRSWFSSKV